MSVDQWQARLEEQPDILWTIIGDIVKIMKSTDSPRRVGRRPSVDGMSMEELWRLLYPERYTLEPFPVALRQQMDRIGNSERAFARKVPCSQTQVNKWLHGQSQPDLPMLERIASAAKVQPSFFLEYRAMRFASMVQNYFLSNPNASIAVAKALKV